MLTLWPQWPLTGLFLAIASWFATGCARSAGTERITSAGHALMGLAMAAMVWNVGLPIWLQVGVFTAMTVWFAGQATVPHRPHGFRTVHHAFMGVGMVWMISAMALPGGHVIMVALAGYFLFAAVALLGRTIDAAAHAAMSAGTGLLLLAM